MSWWTVLTETLWRLVDEHALLTSFVLLLLEESGLPPLIPGDLLMVLAGVRAAEGREHLVVALGVLELATVLGGSVLYWVSAFGGHAVAVRVGRFVGAPPERLRRISAALERHGQRGIILGRLVPSLCILTAVAAGLAGFPYRRFLPALALGGFLHLLILVLLGYLIGPPALKLLAVLHPSFELVAALGALAAIAIGLVWASRRIPATPSIVLPLAERLRRGMLAGVLGAVASGLLSLVLLHVGALLAPSLGLTPPAAAEATQRWSLRVFAVTTMVLFLAVALLWGALYGLIEPLLAGPPWVRGALFAAAPLAVWLVVALPPTAGGWAGLPPGAVLPLVGAEIGRDLTFGLTLGSAYAVMTPHRSGRVRA